MDTILIKNARKSACHSVKLRKVDSCCKSLGLMDAVFDLLKYDEAAGCYMPLKTGLMTGRKGILLVKGLEAGRYKFMEARAPRGYSIGSSSETLFEILPGECSSSKEIVVCNYKLCSPCAPCVCHKTPREKAPKCEQGRSGLLPHTMRYLQDKSYEEIKRYFEG